MSFSSSSSHCSRRSRMSSSYTEQTQGADENAELFFLACKEEEIKDDKVHLIIIGDKLKYIVTINTRSKVCTHSMNLCLFLHYHDLTLQFLPTYEEKFNFVENNIVKSLTTSKSPPFIKSGVQSNRSTECRMGVHQCLDPSSDFWGELRHSEWPSSGQS